MLEIKNLQVLLKTKTAIETLISDVNISLPAQKTLALLGETGSGKSLTALSIMRLLPNNIYISKKSEIHLNGQDLLMLSEVKMREMRGGKIAMVFQEPMTSLNPVFTIGKQIGEVLQVHKKLNGKALKLEACRFLERVQIKDAERVYRSYAHQLSGGMKQRVMIAMALAGNPQLLITDEPTTALDVITQAEILKLLKELQAEFGMSILFITHDLAIAAKLADEVAVMHQGKIVEQGDLHSILHNPQHPYTQKLIHAAPSLKPPVIVADGETVLSVQNLAVRFPIKRGIFNRTVGYVEAVKAANFTIEEGETLAIVGESGSGKTTLARTVVSLIPADQGQIIFLGTDLARLNKKQLRLKREDFQIIFQDPLSAMDPRFQIQDILEEGILALRIGSDAKERQDRIRIVLEQVGLLPEHLHRYPHQLSGGQRQRVCIARALVLGPRLLVCDEPTSSLDVSVQAQIIDLFLQLQDELELSYLFITHNIQLVRAVAHRVAVMQAGEIVEFGEVEEVLNRPQHPYTKALLAAVPSI